MHCNEQTLSPGTMDIVCGRGKGCEELPGNQLFRKLIQIHASTYASVETTRSEKSLLVRTVKEQLKSFGIRFLKRDNMKVWIGLKEKDIIIKIGRALRDVQAVRQKQARGRQRKIAKKRKRTTHSRMIHNKMGSFYEFNTRNVITHDAPSESRLVSSIISGDASSMSRLEELSIDSSDAWWLGGLSTLEVEPTTIEWTSNKEDAKETRTHPTIQQIPSFVQVDYVATNALSSTNFSVGSTFSETRPSCPFSAMDLSFLLHVCEVPIISSSDSSNNSGASC